MSSLNLPVDMVRETVGCRGGKSSPFRNEVIFPAPTLPSLSLTREQSLCGLSPTTIIMQEGERGDGGIVAAGLSRERGRFYGILGKILCRQGKAVWEKVAILQSSQASNLRGYLIMKLDRSLMVPMQP